MASATSRCADACDTACVDVCPVDCIHGPIANDALRDLPQSERIEAGYRLYIDPDECTCCGACVPECPEAAIFDADELPEGEEGELELARRFFAARVR